MRKNDFQFDQFVVPKVVITGQIKLTWSNKPVLNPEHLSSTAAQQVRPAAPRRCHHLNQFAGDRPQRAGCFCFTWTPMQNLQAGLCRAPDSSAPIPFLRGQADGQAALDLRSRWSVAPRERRHAREATGGRVRADVLRCRCLNAGALQQDRASLLGVLLQWKVSVP